MLVPSLARRVRARFSRAFVVAAAAPTRGAVPAARPAVRRAAVRAAAEMLEARQLLTGAPYHGAPAALPGRVQAEDFDLGGLSVGYHDTTATNTGGAYRPGDAVDLFATAVDDAGAGTAVGSVGPGEWLNYTVDVPAAGSYDFTFRVAVPAGGGKFHLQNEAGTNLTGLLTVPNTGNWESYTTLTKAAVALPAGTQTLRLVMDAYGTGTPARVGNFNWFAAAASPAPASAAAAGLPGQVAVSWSAPPPGGPAVLRYNLYRSTAPGGQGDAPYKANLTGTSYTDSAVSPGTTYYYTVAAVYAGGPGARTAEASAVPDINRPFGGTAPALPATIEFENYDRGGEGLAYHDATAANTSNGGAYRPGDGVDLSVTADPGGYAVGAASAGEWLKYTVDVPVGGAYELTFRVSARVAGGRFHVEDEAGTNLTGPLAVPTTGDWLAYRDVVKSGVVLPTGPRVVLRLVLDANGAGQSTVGNFDRVMIREAAPTHVLVRPTSGTAARVSWGTIKSVEPPTGYTVRWVAADGVVASEKLVPPTATSATATGLTPNATYQVQVQANLAGGGQSPAGLAAGGQMPAAAMPANDDTGWYEVTAPGDIRPGDAGYTNTGELHLNGPTGIVYAADADQAAIVALDGSATVTSGPRAGTVSTFPDAGAFEVDAAVGLIGYEDGWDGDNNDNDYNDGQFYLTVAETEAPKVSIEHDQTITEGTAAVLRVRRDKAVDTPVTINLRVGGTAGYGTHFTLPGGLTVTIPAGGTEVAVPLHTTNNPHVNRDRRAVVQVTGYGDEHHLPGEKLTATVTIADDDRVKPGNGNDPDGDDRPHGDPPPGWDDTDPNGDADDPEPDAWVDVSLGWYGWYRDTYWSRDPDEQWYGSTDDGPGETTGGVLRLNRDFDESFDHDGDTPPPTDLDTAAFVPERDNDLVPLWIGAWTDSWSEDAAADSEWTVTWNESKVRVWVPQFDGDGVLTGYAQQSSGWSGSLADLEDYRGAYTWWGNWGAWALVEGVAASGGVDDVSFQATFSPADGDDVNDTVRGTVYDADLDVDSDNNDDFDQPERSPAEEWVEDMTGKDNRPGKVNLVADADVDRDGVPDFADGFDLDPEMLTDDASTGAKFVPVVFEAGSPFSSDARVSFSYSGSDPSEVTASLAAPYVLPSGQLRLWRKDGGEARDKRSVRDGGDYIAPGDYKLTDLGWQPGSPATFYAEMVAQSQSVADVALAMTASPTETSGWIAAGQVRFTAPRIEILGKGYDDSDYTPVDRIINSSLDQAPEYGITVGAYQVHKVRVHDPRESGITQLTIGGQTITLERREAYYETPEFVATRAGSAVNWSVPYQRIVLDGLDEELSYNPRVKQIITNMVNPPEHFKRLRRELDDVVAGMRKEGWVSLEAGDGKAAFGREVDRRLAARMSNHPDPAIKDRWVSDLLVDEKTKVIVGIGAGKSEAGKIQVDHVYMAANGGGKFKIGDVFDMSRVESVHEIKASAINRIRADQRDRLYALTNNSTIHTVNTKYLYTNANGFYLNPWRAVRERAFKLAGIAAAAGVAMGTMNTDADFEYLVNEALRIKHKELNGGYASSTGATQKKHDVDAWVGRFCTHMSAFTPDSGPLDTIRNTMTYAIFLEIIPVSNP